ncbi:MAG: hypothetical protein B6D35_09585 [Candidatus Brocadia sp. UTAMX2]|nr:MAG: hypothetical protein B6D35_09585 [Candidatus Brocadia sp. UTAMX2]
MNIVPEEDGKKERFFILENFAFDQPQSQETQKWCGSHHKTGGMDAFAPDNSNSNGMIERNRSLWKSGSLASGRTRRRLHRYPMELPQYGHE